MNQHTSQTRITHIQNTYKQKSHSVQHQFQHCSTKAPTKNTEKMTEKTRKIPQTIKQRTTLVTTNSAK